MKTTGTDARIQVKIQNTGVIYFILDVSSE